jgi:multidrug efflux system membrane fusion protein
VKKHLLFASIRVLMLLGCIAASGCDKKPAEKAKEAPRVTVAHPITHTLTDEADYNGWLEAFKTVDVRARVRGHITKVYFQDGDLVTEGKTPLFDIDEAPFQAELAQTEAQSKSLESQEVSASKLVERDRILIKSNAVSQQDLDKAEADAKSFVAQIMAKKAEADRIRLDLKYAKIIAPLTGKIGKANLVVGDLVNAGGTDPVLATIVTVDPVYVDFNVDERAIQRYQQADSPRSDKQQSLRERGIKFTFGLDTEKGFPHVGTLVFADIKYTEGTGTILVRGVAENKDGLFIPGSRARVRLPVGDKYSATLVPDAAVCTDQKQKYLLVVGGDKPDDKNAKRVNVELGRLLDDGMRVVISPALKADAWIITEGMERARLNYPVEPIPEAAAEVAAAVK